MGMGLLATALAGAGQGLGAGIAETSMLQMKDQMEQNRMQRMEELRRETDALNDKRRQENFDKRANTDGTPENIARQKGLLGLESDRNANEQNKILQTGSGLLADGTKIITNDQGVQRVDQNGNVMKTWASRDDYMKDQMSPAEKAKLDSETSQAKLREAQGRLNDAQARMVGSGMGKGGVAQERLDMAGRERYIRDNADLYTLTDPMGKPVKNVILESAFRNAVNTNPEGAVRFFNDLKASATKMATDKDGNVDEELVQKYYLEKVKEFRQRVSGSGTATDTEGNPGQSAQPEKKGLLDSDKKLVESEDSGWSLGQFDHVLDMAKGGSGVAKAQLKFWLEQGDLREPQRRELKSLGAF